MSHEGTKPRSHEGETEACWLANRVLIPVQSPSRILVVPWGEVRSTRGTFIVDQDAARAITESFTARGTELVVDYEHQTIGGEFASPDGVAPAAGWIKSLETVPGQGIFANVEWTPRAAEMIRNKEYRYVSPVVLLDAKSKRVMALGPVGLTNTPAIRDMRPIVNSANSAGVPETKEFSMNEIRKALGLADGADESACVAAINKCKTEAAAHSAATTLRITVCKAVGLAETAKDDEVVASVNKAVDGAKKVTPTGDIVPKAEFDALAKSHSETVKVLSETSNRLNKREASERIEKALSEGKLTPAMLQKDDQGANYFLALAEKPEEWEAWMKRSPVVAPIAGRVTAHSSGAAPAAGGRTGIIAAARAEFEANRKMIPCSARAYISEALREQKMTPITDEEAKTIVA